MKGIIGERGLKNHLNEIVMLERRDARYLGLHSRLRLGDPNIGILGSDYLDRNGREMYYIETPLDKWHDVKEGILRLRRDEKIYHCGRWHVPIRDGDFIIIFDDVWISPPPLLGPYRYRVHLDSVDKKTEMYE